MATMTALPTFAPRPRLVGTPGIRRRGAGRGGSVRPARPRHTSGRPAGAGCAYWRFDKFANMRRVSPFSTAMSADEKSCIARR